VALVLHEEQGKRVQTQCEMHDVGLCYSTLKITTLNPGCDVV